jgi:hypothetical protein
MARPAHTPAREAPTVRAILKALNEIPGCRAVRRAVATGTHLGRVGDPDIAGCYLGRAFFLEVKAPGRENTVTDMQARELRLWAAAGARVGIVSSVLDAIAIARGMSD